MSKIRIVTDSTADLPLSVRQSYGIEMVPLKVHFGHEAYQDSVTIQSEQFYEKLASASALPTTSQPSPAEFAELYRSILDREPDAHIISVHLSSSFSGTYQSAFIGRSMLDEPDRVTVIDSKSASIGLGTMTLAAAEAAKLGRDVDQCVQETLRLRSSIGLYFLVDTLEFLHKGGRIGKAAAMFGSLLNIKPILTIDDEGVVASIDKVRGTKKAMARIAELLQERFAGQKVKAVFAHSNAQEAAEQFCSVLKESFEMESVSYTSLGSVIGAHVGPGTIAVLFSPV